MVVKRGTGFIRPVFSPVVLAITAKLIYDAYFPPALSGNFCFAADGVDVNFSVGFVRWCNGNTAPFGGVIHGSNPCRTANLPASSDLREESPQSGVESAQLRSSSVICGLQRFLTALRRRTQFCGPPMAGSAMNWARDPFNVCAARAMVAISFPVAAAWISTSRVGVCSKT